MLIIELIESGKDFSFISDSGMTERFDGMDEGSICRCQSNWTIYFVVYLGESFIKDVGLFGEGQENSLFGDGFARKERDDGMSSTNRFIELTTTFVVVIAMETTDSVMDNQMMSPAPPQMQSDDLKIAQEKVSDLLMKDFNF